MTSKEQARQKQLDFLERMKVFEEVYEDELPAGTHVMSGRWVDTMKTSTMWRSEYTARGYEEPHSDEGCFASSSNFSGTRSFCGRLTTQKFSSTLKSAKANSCMHSPEDSDGWQTCGVESAQGHAGSSNISETLAGNTCRAN